MKAVFEIYSDDGTLLFKAVGFNPLEGIIVTYPEPIGLERDGERMTKGLVGFLYRPTFYPKDVRVTWQAW